MIDVTPDILQVSAALLAAAFASAAFLAAGLLYGRFAVGPPSRGVELRTGGSRGVFAALRSAAILPIAQANERWVPALPLERIDRWLRKAGRPLELTATEVVALMQVTALLFFAGAAALSLCLRLGFGAWFLGLIGGAAYPLIWLRDRMKTRQRSLVRALPYAVDLLTLSVEAGLDFAAALSKVAERGRAGPLAHELSVVLRELRLGKTREDALRNLARRVELPALTSFVQALVHADRMGTPLGKVLRILSTQLRVERTQRAEKLANEAPVKLLVPLVLCIFPTLFLMLFGPLAYQLFFEGTF